LLISTNNQHIHNIKET